MNFDLQLQQAIDQIFPQYDRDYSGTLNPMELPGFINTVLMRMGCSQANSMQIQQIMRNADQNCDYQATRQELFFAIKRYMQTSVTGMGGVGMGGMGGVGMGGMGGFNQGMGGMGGVGGMGNFNQGMGGMGGFNQGMGGVGGMGRHQHWNRCQIRNPREEMARDMIDQIYARYDRDGSGSLDQMEFPMAFNEVLMQLSIPAVAPQQAMGYMMQIDRSGNGRVERPEFFACVQRLL